MNFKTGTGLTGPRETVLLCSGSCSRLEMIPRPAGMTGIRLRRRTKSAGEFTLGQVSHQLQIGFEKIVRGQLRSLRPAQITKNSVFDFAGIFVHVKKAQFHGTAVRIFVADARDFISDDRLDSKFFIQFAAQRVPGLLAFFNLSSRELPLERHGLVASALADEYLSIFPDERGHHAFHDENSLCVSARVG